MGKGLPQYPRPNYSTYVGIISREKVCISLTYDALNLIDVMYDDIKIHTSNIPLLISIILYAVQSLVFNTLEM